MPLCHEGSTLLVLCRECSLGGLKGLGSPLRIEEILPDSVDLVPYSHFGDAKWCMVSFIHRTMSTVVLYVYVLLCKEYPFNIFL